MGLLAEDPGLVLLKRCVDVDDLMATATAGQAEAAVVALDASGLDASALDHLRRHGVRAVAVVPVGTPLEAAQVRAARIGVAAVVEERDLVGLTAAVVGAAQASTQASTRASTRASSRLGEAGADPDPREIGDAVAGRTVAVWGPQGAPGRTTLSTAIAAELAGRGEPVTLIDADPYGGGVAQHLGILDQASGLLTAARLAASGALEERLHTCLREVSPGLAVLTGLPRPDRWVEVRAGTLEHVVEVSGTRSHVVIDTGFSLEDDPRSDFGSRPGRNSLTLAALEVVDEVVVIGTADPIGLARLARGLVELREVTGAAPVRVVVNRNRSTLGWSERDVAGMVEGFTRLRGLHFLPDDRESVDRALVAGQTLVESGPSSLSDAVADLVEEMLPSTSSPPRRRWLRRRTAGTDRRR